ncbi:MAG: hypothetical protein A4E57_02314 [Syntrophorhabdaceae bacterium PtaU1.Bin034]|jgi:acyl-CoA thioesterase FadM|nr:MAG: hypothetical protein A4E57_02314 [Syntrophorhabdaceae bacterium PtaU1.Bin034]
MPRIKLIEKPNYKFHMTITLQPRDINYAKHLGNDALVSLIGTARVNALHSMGLSEADLGDGHTGVIMSDLIVNFKAEAYMLDELTVDTQMDDFTRTSFRMHHRVMRGPTLIALAELGFAAFDYNSKKIAPVPPRFLELLGKYGSLD